MTGEPPPGAESTERAELEQLLSESEQLAQDDLKTQLQWLHRCAHCVERSGLGEAGVAAATDLRAALGAVIRWTNQGAPADQRDETRQLMGALVLRAMGRMYRALADSYTALSQQLPQDEDCRELAAAFSEAATAVENGDPIPASAARRIADARRRLTLP